MNASAAIRCEGLVKDYVSRKRLAGRTVNRALNGVDLDIQQGEVFGFLGPNGAGKTTAIRLMMDLLRPTAGHLEVLGVAPTQGGPQLRQRIGYLPGDLMMRSGATARDVLEHLARLRQGRGADRVEVLAERLTLDLARPVKALSKGNRQKIGVIQAFMHRPELLILDEPTSGLDPLLQHEFFQLVREAKADGATVFMSSHVLSEVELIADRVGVVRSGAMVDVDTVAALHHRAGQVVEFEFSQPVDPGVFGALNDVDDVVVDGRQLRCLLHGEPDALLKAAAAHHVVRWSARDRELEELFLDFYRQPTTHDQPGGVATTSKDAS